MNTKLRCLLLDDELEALTYLRLLCSQLPDTEVVKAFNDPAKLLQELPDLEFDVCIMDIEMPGLNGLQMAALMQGKPIIFITAYKEYAVSAFDLEAIDYICKPVQKSRLEKALHKVAAKIAGSSIAKTYFIANTARGKTIIYFDHITYITVADKDKRDKIVQLENGSSLLLKNITFDNLLQVLPPNDFCRINKKDIVASKAVLFFSAQEITIHPDNSDKEIFLPLTDTYREQFFQIMHK